MNKQRIAAAFFLAGLLTAAVGCGSGPNGEHYTFAESDTQYTPPATDDEPAACNPEDGCASDAQCGEGYVCDMNECVCVPTNL